MYLPKLFSLCTLWAWQQPCEVVSMFMLNPFLGRGNWRTERLSGLSNITHKKMQELELTELWHQICSFSLATLCSKPSSPHRPGISKQSILPLKQSFNFSRIQIQRRNANKCQTVVKCIFQVFSSLSMQISKISSFPLCIYGVSYGWSTDKGNKHASYYFLV